MNSSIRAKMRVSLRLALILPLLVLLAGLGNVSPAQTPTPSPSPEPSPTPAMERQFLKNIVRDQKAIWTSPFHVREGDAKWMAPLGLTAGALIVLDRRTAGSLHDDPLRLKISRDVSTLGSGYGAGAIAGSLYVIGRWRGDDHLRRTALLGGEALIDGGIVAAVLKEATQRTRPRALEPGDFFEGGHSFPSGHTIAAWSLATVVAKEYKGHRAIQILAYGLAAVVSASRFTGRNHFLSDIVVGSAIGYGIGNFVYKHQ